MNDHVGMYAYLRYLRDLVLRQPRREPIWCGSDNDTMQNGQGTLRKWIVRVRNGLLWNNVVRRLIYPFDLVIFLFYRLYIEALRNRVLIMDRYFYDTLVDVSADRGSRWVRVLEFLTPTPHIPIYLDISAEESYARKGEYSVEYLRARRTHYQKVFHWVDRAVILPNSGSIDVTIRNVEKVVLEQINK
jgi:hypothetical protein